MAHLIHTTAPAVSLEIAVTERQRFRGLRGRHRLPWYQGMLFVFPEEANHRFTMKDTLLPLDMIFFDPELTVVGIVHSAAPLTSGPYGVAHPSQYVLEVNGGWAAAHRIELGDPFQYTR